MRCHQQSKIVCEVEQTHRRRVANSMASGLGTALQENAEVSDGPSGHRGQRALTVSKYAFLLSAKHFKAPMSTI